MSVSIKINAKPTADRVFIQVDEAESTSASGIVLSTKDKEDASTGVVVAVGPGRVVESGRAEPINLNIGQRVIFNKYAGTKVKLDGHELLVVKEDDVIGAFE